MFHEVVVLWERVSGGRQGQARVDATPKRRKSPKYQTCCSSTPPGPPQGSLSWALGAVGANRPSVR